MAEAPPPAPPPPSRIDEKAEAEVRECLRDGRLGDALKILMRVYGTWITSFIFRILRHRQDTEDVRQTVFLQAFTGFSVFEGRSSFYTWLTSIAFHRCMDAVKKGRRAKNVDHVDILNALHWQADPGMDAGVVAKRRALERCLGKLPEALRGELLMRFYLGLSFVEIEAIEKVPAATIQMRMSRILPRLRQCLNSRGVGR